jgi:hypothetical protein
VTQKVDSRRKTLPFVVDLSFLNEECQMATIGNLHYLLLSSVLFSWKVMICILLTTLDVRLRSFSLTIRIESEKLAGYFESSSVIELILGVSFFRAYKN